MARRLEALGFLAAMTLAMAHAASAADAYTVRVTKPMAVCSCRAPAVHRVAIRHRYDDAQLAWAQTIETDPRRDVFIPQPVVPPAIIEGPTYNYTIYNFYGPPPVMPAPGYYADDDYGYGGLPPADDKARLDPWNGYNPYAPENGY